MSGPIHLARRFFGSLSPRPLAPEDDAWVRSRLSDGEVALWVQMSRADRKHAAGVAREVDRLLGGDVSQSVVAAGALHDVGKIDSDLSTVVRAAVTVASAVLGRDRLVAGRGVAGWRGRVASYLEHDVVGAALLADARSDAITVRWAREHHLASSAWTIDRRLADALCAADDD